MMQRTPIEAKLSDFPADFHRFLRDARLYDSSCSKEARVYFIDRDGGYFLKSAPAGTLQKEAAMDRFFHEKAVAKWH